MNEQDLYDVYKYALAFNGLTLEYIVEQNCHRPIRYLVVPSLFVSLTSELYLIAVKNNGYALRFIDCYTDKICIAAIKSVAEKQCDDPGKNQNGLSNRHLFSRTADQLAGIGLFSLPSVLVPKIEVSCINNFNKFGITTSNY